MAKLQKKLNQHAHAANPIPLAHPSVVENPMPPPPNNSPDHIPMGAPGGVPPTVLNPLIIEINEQQDAFFNPRAASMYEAFSPPTNEVEKKVKAIEENLRAVQSTNCLGLDAAEMCFVPGVIIPTKFKVPDFEKYKGASDPGTYVRAYHRKMATYSDDD